MRVRLFNIYEPVVPLFRDLSAALADDGVDVEVVVSAGSYRSRARSDPFAAARRRSLPAPSLLPGRAGRAVVSVGYALGVVILTAFGPRADVNVVLTQPPLLAVWFRILRRLRGQRYICHVMDLYPEVLSASGVLADDHPAIRLTRRLDTWALRGCDAIVAIGRCMRDRIIARGIDEDRILMIPNWQDDALLASPADGRALRAKAGIEPSAVVVLYAGNIGVGHDLDGLVTATAAVREDVHVLVVGEGSRRRSLEQRIEQEGATHVTIIDFEPHDQIAEVLAAGDIHFVSLRQEFTGLVVPSKAGAAMAAGRPLIYQGDGHGEVARLVEEHDLGVVVPRDDTTALAEAVSRLARDVDARRQAGQRARALARGDLGAAKGAARYARLLHHVAADLDRRVI